MSTRKGQSKYYSPDFDPEELEKFVDKQRRLHKGLGPKKLDVRMMLPMSVRCNACGEYMYKGKKFNSKKETVEGEDYCGVKVFRFYFKCTNCKNVFTIKTDPKNADYAVELNCSRGVDVRKDEMKEIETNKVKREEEEKDDVIKKLENQSADTLRQLRNVEQLEVLKQMKRDEADVNIDDIIQKVRQEKIEHLEKSEKNVEKINFLKIREKKINTEKKPKKEEKKKKSTFL
ncbi:coiled-coil domain containing protein, putative [Entamoeba invadens IP1]|uniref:Coiled-coil domain containing protein, putative n=1 Tax=Entamoeba invadens IP1 TaxID=370355 RepID=A0A0A1UDT8_ENTIV|nr:coiled-coil domain containing protein, putative [Entamoeba invadens IP1]ELP94770.1 coiled-coil domain containing protein, putative [Entamoeba invadens IP1]|eukprot:XP_004261541.1 coiled-coil domain containing protein, putative [Entamoeba invadens IP1]